MYSARIDTSSNVTYIKDIEIISTLILVVERWYLPMVDYKLQIQGQDGGGGGFSVRLVGGLTLVIAQGREPSTLIGIDAKENGDN